MYAYTNETCEVTKVNTGVELCLIWTSGFLHHLDQDLLCHRELTCICRTMLVVCSFFIICIK